SNFTLECCPCHPVVSAKYCPCHSNFNAPRISMAKIQVVKDIWTSSQLQSHITRISSICACSTLAILCDPAQ
ncbi:hypothetical protein BGZ82_004391, partial [Podila clonocystis]